MELREHAFSKGELKVSDVPAAVKGVVVLRRRGAGGAPLPLVLRGLALVGAVTSEDALVQLARVSSVAGPSRNHAIGLVGEEDGATSLFAPLEVDALLAHLREVAKGCALKGDLLPTRGLEHGPGRRPWHNIARRGVGRAALKLWGALRVLQHCGRDLVEAFFPSGLDNRLPCRVLTHIGDELARLPRQSEAHALLAGDSLLHCPVPRVQVVIGLRRKGLEDLLVPLLVELRAPCDLMSLALPQSHRGLVSEAIPARDALEEALEARFAGVLYLLHVLQHDLVVPRTCCLALLPFRGDLQPSTLLGAQHALVPGVLVGARAWCVEGRR
mmetsp:Transcript_83153/g.178271  ORF Transcript_83153/g.178271 Transcript_83153/m.178271 type:complete len:328 (+) Transcript_83153:72-1055(+)